MSEAAIIHSVFKEVFGRRTDFSSFDDRLEAQKIVYLLGELGVTCGDYSFRWYKHGPYSQNLQNVLLGRYDDAEQIVFSVAGTSALKKVKQMISIPHSEYTDSQWLEAMGSIHYLQKHMYSTLARDSILNRLSNLKPHLNNQELNTKAYNLLQQESLL